MFHNIEYGSAISNILLLSVLPSSIVFAAECQVPAEVVGNLSLAEGCTLHKGIRIERSNVILDCKGAVLDGGGTEKFGIMVVGKGINNVQVKNCIVKNFSVTGILVSAGIKAKDWTADVGQNYAVAPHDIRFSKLTVIGSGRGGVYFNDYVHDSSLEDSTVQGSGKVGVYLEQATKNISLFRNKIYGNGFSGNVDQYREGLAIDSSGNNVIKDNEFSGNAAGGIFLYKNCGEQFSKGESVIRWQHSNNNMIVGNKFSEPEIGIWIASRQSKNLHGWDCGDPSIDLGKNFYRDYADDNVVFNNSFCSAKTAIVIEGDKNAIQGNAFASSVGIQVSEPHKNRPKYDGTLSVQNVVRGSISASCK